MSTGQAHLPEGSDFKKAAAWELIVASIILAVMFLVRYCMNKGFVPKLTNIFKPMMVENGNGHLILYFVLFCLVFSSAMSFFVD
jgi:hypothetical protein